MNLRKSGLLFVVLATAAALLAVAGSAAGATFGEPDDGEHPYVGLIYFETPDGVYRCSGALIDPEVVLTAGHCTETEGQVNWRTWVTFDEKVVIPEDVLLLPDDEFGNWLDSQTRFIKGTAVPHPMYDDFSGFPLTYDIGVVVLDEEVTGVGTAALPDGDVLGMLKGQEKSGFQVVGYGLQGYINPFFGAERARYTGDVRLVEVHSRDTAKGLASAKFTNSPGVGKGSGGSCFGDSGGPVLYDGDTVVAVVSWGITPCIGVDFQYRVDSADSLAFIAEVLGGLD